MRKKVFELTLTIQQQLTKAYTDYGNVYTLTCNMQSEYLEIESRLSELERYKTQGKLVGNNLQELSYLKSNKILLPVN